MNIILVRVRRHMHMYMLHVHNILWTVWGIKVRGHLISRLAQEPMLGSLIRKTKRLSIPYLQNDKREEQHVKKKP